MLLGKSLLPLPAQAPSILPIRWASDHPIYPCPSADVSVCTGGIGDSDWPLEAQACGTPVIAYGRGGALETVRGLDAVPDAPTGLFFAEQSVAAVVEAVQRFERDGAAIAPGACRDNALRFAPERFREEFMAFVEQEWMKLQRVG